MGLQYLTRDPVHLQVFIQPLDHIQQVTDSFYLFLNVRCVVSIRERNLFLLAVVDDLYASQEVVLFRKIVLVDFLPEEVTHYREHFVLSLGQLVTKLQEFRPDLIIERGNLVIQVADHILVLMSPFQFVLDWTHIVEASHQEEIQELDCGPIVSLQVLSSVKGIDDFSVYELGLEALEMGALGELVLLLLLQVFLFALG